MKKILLLAILLASFYTGYSQCIKPTAVQITSGSNGAITICEGTALPLSGIAIIPTASIQGGFRYAWIKTAPTSSTLVPPTIIFTSSGQTLISIPTYFGITGQITDAGTYVLHVEDGQTGNPACYTVATVVVNVIPTVTTGVISAAQTICSGGDPVAFTQTTAASGGTGVYTYQWEKSINSGAYADIAGAGAKTFDEGALTNFTPTVMTVDYRRKVTSGSGACPQVTTAPVRITVNPTIVPGVIAASQTICSGGNPAAFTQTAAASGGTGTYTYVWQSSATSAVAGFATIASATASTYDAPTGLTATTYYRRVDASGTCMTANTNVITVTVIPAPVPAVSIATPTTTICAGTSITLTASPSNGGVAPTYQWRKNGVVIAGSTGVSYTTTSAANGDSYDVHMASMLGCASPATATSNPIVITVTSTVISNVTITATPGNTICPGTSVTFTASPGNGGTAPTYEWIINGASQGAPSTTATTFTSTSLTNGDQVFVRMTSNSGCVAAPGAATSNVITMSVNPVVTPSVSISAFPSTMICAGTSITITATPTNGGTTPPYQWIKNGVPIPTATNATYTTTTAVNWDSYSVQMTSSLNCASPPTATSNAIVVTVNPIVQPNVSITADRNTICTNGQVTFTATPINGGTVPIYEWSVNAVSQGAPSGSPTFTTTALTSSSDVVRVTMTGSTVSCALPNTATANMSINVSPGISAGTIVGDQTICYNSIPAAITQITAPTNIGGMTMYTWEVSLDGATIWTPIVGASGSTYTFSSPLTQDIYIRRVITDPGTPAPCNKATSNSIHITVNPQLIAGVISANETICAGTAASTITQTIAATGGTGTYTYQWESSTTAFGPYANIASATGSTYSPGVLTATRYFRRIETSGMCASMHSNEVAKIVVPTTVPTIHIDDPGQTCDGDIVLFKCQATTVGSNPVYNWYVNNNLIASGSPTFTLVNALAPLKSGDEVWTELISNSTCANTGSVISNKVIVDLVPCTVSNSIYTTSNIDILMQPYVSNSVPNSTGFVYFWSITDGSTTTSVNTSMSQAGINLFPNPTTESFNIEMPESGLDVSYEILDVTGARVANGAFTSTGNAQKIDTNFGAGMYQVVLHYNNVVTCARLSKVE